MRKVKIYIAGSEYIITTPHEKEYVEELSKIINNRILTIMNQNTAISLNSALVLLLLEYLDNCEIAKKSEDNIRSQMKGYIEESVLARKEVSDLRKEINILREEKIKTSSEE